MEKAKGWRRERRHACSNFVCVSLLQRVVFRRLPAVMSEMMCHITVDSCITVNFTHLYIFCFENGKQSIGIIFPLFLLIMAERIRKQLQEITLGINDEAISVSFDLSEEAVNETKYSIVVKPVNPRKQNLRAMLNALPRLWGVGDEVAGRILENKKIQFIFQSEETMASVLRRGPCTFNEWMCITQRWNPLLTDDDLKHIPFWVQVKGIPLHFLTKRMVREVGIHIGNYFETDFDSEGAVLVDYVRVKLLWNVDLPLRFQRLFKFGDVETVLKFRYEKLRNFCNICGMMSHDAGECPMNAKTEPSEEGDDDNDEDGDYPPGFDGANNTNGGPEPFESAPSMEQNEGHNSTSTRKRKAEESSSNSDDQPTTKLICYEMRQGYTLDNSDECFSKRRRAQSETMEVRNWFFQPNEEK